MNSGKKHTRKKTRLFMTLVAGFLLTGCTQVMNLKGSSIRHFDPTVVFRPAEAENILSCLQEKRGAKPEEVEKYLKAASGKTYTNNDQDRLLYICLTLHQAATYKQFTDGMATLKQYIDTSPDNHPDLQGLLYILERFDQARISRWSARKTLGKEKKRMGADNEELRELLKQANTKIDELNDQITKLKNIEKIISDREQHDTGTLSYE